MSYIVASWLEGMQQVSAEIDEHFGEALVITPCEVRPNFGPRPLTEQAVHVLGVFRWRSETDLVMSNDRAQHGRGGLVESRKPIVEFSRDALPFALKRLDRVTRSDGDTFEITAVEPDGISRITCTLVQLGRQEQ